MKNKTIVIMIVFIMLCLVSCDNDIHYLENETEAAGNTGKNNAFEYTYSYDSPISYNGQYVTGDFIYYDGCLYFKSDTLMRYNCETGNITSVCADPVCNHNSYDCPFYFMFGAFSIYKDKIFYRITHLEYDKESYMEQVFYDINTKSVKAYERIDTTSSGDYYLQLFHDNYRYYYDYRFNEETMESKDTICRMNIDTGKIETLTDDIDTNDIGNLLHYSETFLFMIDSRIYFTDGQRIYSTDLDLKSRADHVTGAFLSDVYTDGEYIYYGVIKDDMTDVYRMKFDGSENKSLGITVKYHDEWQLTENYIYYKTPDFADIGKVKIRGYASDRVELYGSEIRRCRHDGSDNELVYKFEGDMANCRIIGLSVYGNYIYGNYQDWIDKDGNGVFEEGENYDTYNDSDYKFMRINVTTGEIYYINVPR